MVNEENLKFAYKHPDYTWTREDPRWNREAFALIDRVLHKQKPFALVHFDTDPPGGHAHPSELTKKDVKDIYNKLKRRRDVAVSKMWDRPAETEWQHDSHAFFISRKGTLADNFDLKALAHYYREEGLPQVAADIPKKSHYTLPSYFGTFDFQDYYREPPRKGLRKPPVEPWETGLILGYPIDSTIHIIYYGEGE